MSIEVGTNEEVFTVEGTKIYAHDDGTLVITGVNFERVAIFAKGEWVYAIRREPTTAAPKPRSWQRVSDIPVGVTARSAGGCLWKNQMWSSQHAKENGYWYDKSAPFTEVLDGTEPFPGTGDDV